jgi:gas vesicle protein
MSNNQSGRFIGGLLVGVALGTLTGMLLAPRTGRETRRMLRKSADALPELVEDLSSSLQLQTDRLSDSAKLSWAETLERLRTAISDGVEATQHQRQLLKQTAIPGDDAYPMDVLEDDNLPTDPR